MYPKFSDLINDLLGTNIQLPFQMFGFMLGISFLCAAISLHSELKRKYAQGLLPKVKITQIKGAKATPMELFSAALFGFIIGFKGVYGILNYSKLVDDPQTFLLSMDGNWIAGIIGAIAFAYYQYSDSEKKKLDTPKTIVEWVEPKHITGNFTINAMIGGILGAKIFHMLENMDDFYRDPIDAIISFSGLTFYGGVIVATITILWYSKKLKFHPLHISDSIVPGLMLAYATGRLGCQLSGDGDWGINNLNPQPSWFAMFPSWAWAYDYPHNVLGEGVAIANCEGKFCTHLEYPVYPTPLYEFVACSILFLIMWVSRKRVHLAGFMTCLYLVLNGVERFLIELIRINNKINFFGIVCTQAELIATIMVLAGLIGFVLIYKNRSKLYLMKTTVTEENAQGENASIPN